MKKRCNNFLKIALKPGDLCAFQVVLNYSWCVFTHMLQLERWTSLFFLLVQYTHFKEMVETAGCDLVRPLFYRYHGVLAKPPQQLWVRVSWNLLPNSISSLGCGFCSSFLACACSGCFCGSWGGVRCIVCVWESVWGSFCRFLIFSVHTVAVEKCMP